MSDSIVFQPIGVIRSEHLVPQEIPIQPVYAGDCHGCLELLPEFEDGLHDIDGIAPSCNGWQDEVDEKNTRYRGKRSFRGGRSE